MKYRSLACLAALALATACSDVPTSRTPAGPSLAVAPAGGITAIINRNGNVEISWTHDGAGITRWRIYRRPLGQTAWAAARSTADARARRLVDGNYDVNIDAWQWMVQGCNGTGCTESAPVTATGLRLTAPPAVWVTASSIDGVSLAWTLGGGPAQYTQLEVRPSVSGSAVLVRRRRPATPTRRWSRSAPTDTCCARGTTWGCLRTRP
ncbi:MAG TPA: hypothetical protein VNP72_01230 [Longimicrobium sp.]|nr:hypothetical protein [Longimicrobium sp.]